MNESILPDDLDAQARERLGRLTLALAEDIERLNDPSVTAVMKALMREIGRVIAHNFDDDLGDSWQQHDR